MTESYMARYGARLVDGGYPILPILPGSKAPGRYRSGAWTGYPDWPRHCDRPTKAFELDIWEKWPDAGIGIACGRLIGLDIDILDGEVVTRIEALAKKKLGDTPATRIGQSPKRLLVYRAEKPFRSIKRHPLEILGRGSQFVAYADHPGTRQPYQWPVDSLVDLPLSLLPVVSEESARTFLEEAWQLVPPQLRTSRLGADRSSDYYLSGGSLQGTREAVTSAIEHIPNDNLPYDDWVRIGMALKGALGDAGEDLFVAWSQRASKSGSSGKSDTPSRAFRSFRPDRIGAGTIYHYAEQHGWACPSDLTMNGAIATLEVEQEQHPAAGLIARAQQVNGHAVEHEAASVPKETEQLPDGIIENAGGLLSEIASWMCETAIYPQPFLALGAAIAALGTAAGRRFAGPMDTRTNIYCIGIAPSGSGKEHQLTCLNNMFFAADLIEFFAGEEIASGTAIESTIAMRAVQLFQIDEFGHFMRSVLNPRATSSHKRDVLVKLTKYTGAATRLVKGTEYANKKERERVDVHDPCVCLYGTTVAAPLWEAFGSGALNDGSVARMLFFQSPLSYPSHHKPVLFAKDVPEGIIAGLRQVVAGRGANDDFGFKAAKGMALDGRNPPALVRIGLDENAAVLADELADEQVRLKRDHELSEFVPVMARWLEHINRLALIRAVSRNPIGTVIIVEDLEWARSLVDHCIGTLTSEAQRFIADNQHEADLKRLLHIIRKHGQMSGRELARKTQFLSVRDRNQHLSQLAEAEQIFVQVEQSTGGRPGFIVGPLCSSEQSPLVNGARSEKSE